MAVRCRFPNTVAAIFDVSRIVLRKSGDEFLGGEKVPSEGRYTSYIRDASRIPKTLRLKEREPRLSRTRVA